METGSLVKRIAQGEGTHYFFFFGALILVGFAAFGVIDALTSTNLIAGPTFRVDDPELVGARLELTPGVLESAGLRIGWAVASAVTFLGVALGVFTLSQVSKRVPEQSFFSKEIQSLIQLRTVFSLLLVVIGRLGRGALRGSIRDDLGIVEILSESAGGSPFLSSFLFEMNFFSMYAIVLIIGWVIAQGATAHADAQDIV